MVLDLSTLAPRVRARHLRTGRAYSAEDILAQAHQTLLAHAMYGPLLVPFGFGLGDGGRVADARDEMHARKLGRTQVSSNRKALRNSHTDARRNARTERRCVRSALELVFDDLLHGNQLEAAGIVDVALEQTTKPPTKDQALLEQLETLSDVLGEPLVVQAMVERGGPEIQKRLDNAKSDLRTAMRLRAANPALPAVADERDILGGMIVSLARAASRAARVAARHLGQPAIEEAFRLTHLRARRGSAPEPELPESPETPELPGTEPPIVTEPVIK